MSSADKKEYAEDLLIRYLLGSLSAEESERLDELSIVDDEFAWRLKAVENDLVDAFLRNELPGETLERFRSMYLSSPGRQERVEFARTLLRWNETAAGAEAVAGAEQGTASLTARSAGGFWVGLSRLSMPLGLAAAALMMCALAGYLLLENSRLRRLGAESREQQASLDQRAHELEKQLNEQRSANTEMQKEQESLRKSQAGSSALKSVAFLLLPQTRGVSQISTVAVPRGTSEVKFRLQLESDDFPQYSVALLEPATNREEWQKASLKSTQAGKNKGVPVNIPGALLRTKTYVLEVSGVAVNGRSEFVSSYAFRLVLE
jgi:hypothetical protein